MKVSYIIITRNRRERLLATIEQLHHNTLLSRQSWELLVVDNASDDGTPAAVRRACPAATVIALPENEGMPARNRALARARGRYLVFLDDDSYPGHGMVTRALGYLSRRPRTAALVARVQLPGGQSEAPAFPGVTLGGASIIRRSVIEQVGGFAPEFFRQAEEYDLSFRIWDAGYRIERFEDIVFHHDKSESGRSSALTHRMDVRNNLILAERYLPRPLRAAYRRDWMRRYTALARHDGHADAAGAAIREARIWARREAAVGRRILNAATIESLFELDQQANLVRNWARRHTVNRVMIADYSKNIFATWRACQHAGLQIAGVVDSRPAFAGRSYRSAPIVAEQALTEMAPQPDGIVLSNVNPAQVEAKMRRLGEIYAGPILQLWHPRQLAGESASADSQVSAA